MRTLATLTWFNKIGLVVLLVGIGYLLVQGQLFGAAAFGVALVYLAVSVRRSVTARANDSERVAAAQPFDERDASAMTGSFAIVGQFAFLGQTALVIWHLGRPDEPGLLAAALTLVTLAVVLGVGNRVALRRV